MMEMMNMTRASGANVTAAVMNMMPFHTMVGMDTLWFSSWMPADVGATFGACIGLFLLSIFYRFTVTICSTIDTRSAATTFVTKGANQLGYPAFDFKRDVPRGFLEGLSAFLGYLLMLAVMVMNAWFFIAIILGIIVGETSFRRFAWCVSQRGAKAMADGECC